MTQSTRFFLSGLAVGSAFMWLVAEVSDNSTMLLGAVVLFVLFVNMVSLAVPTKKDKS